MGGTDILKDVLPNRKPTRNVWQNDSRNIQTMNKLFVNSCDNATTNKRFCTPVETISSDTETEAFSKKDSFVLFSDSETKSLVLLCSGSNVM